MRLPSVHIRSVNCNKGGSVQWGTGEGFGAGRREPLSWPLSLRLQVTSLHRQSPRPQHNPPTGASRTFRPTDLGLPPFSQDPTSAAISCPSPGVCVAVGNFDSGGVDLAVSNYGVYADFLLGGQWTLDILPLPADATSAKLDSISCVSATNCTAVGIASVGTGSFGPSETSFLAETLSGSTWTPTTLAVAVTGTGSDLGLNSVSCPSATSCMAVGSDEPPIRPIC